jgi:hypothetical protein
MFYRPAQGGISSWREVSMDENQIIALWGEIKAIIDDLELDVVKNAKGNAAAGLRARKVLRELKAKASSLVKTSLEQDKANKLAAKAK